MDAQQVKDKILADAKAEAEKILADAKAKQDELKKAFDHKIAGFKKKTTEMAVEMEAEKKSHILAQGRMEVAKSRLAGKRKILDEVFTKAEQLLISMGDDDYRTLMIKLMTTAAETGSEEVVVDNNEKRIDESLLSQVNKNLGEKGNLKLSDEKANIGAGFLLRRGKINVNASATVLINEARKSLEIDIAKDLFATAG
jgi:V/A-type H+-transporting ATPase subunit E